MRHSASSGFTLLEVTITTLLLLPLIAALVSAGKLVIGSVGASESAAGLSDAVGRTVQRVEGIVRSGVYASLRIRAEQKDVDDGYAASVGEWILPRDFEARRAIDLNSTGGQASTDITAPTVQQRLEFVLDADETDNGVDDDGDGLVDEGHLRWQVGGIESVLLRGVETCTFTPEGRLIRFTLECARRGSQGEMRRATVTQNIFIRNS